MEGKASEGNGKRSRRNWKELEQIGTNRKEWEEIGRNQKEMERIRRNQRESEGNAVFFI